MNTPNVLCGIAHSKTYKKSPIYDLTFSITDDHIDSCSDIHLLLHQKNLSATLGVDVLRRFVQGLVNTDKSQTPNLSDDELFELIDSKHINTLTDSYEFARYLQANEKSIKSKLLDLKARKEFISNYANGVKSDLNK